MEQLASISAVLGGFAVTFLSVMLTHRDDRRRVGVLLALTTAVAACFFVAALGWSLIAATKQATDLHRPLSLLFISATGLLFIVLGLGGWLRSRALGVVTTAIGLVAACSALAVIKRFIH